MANAEELWFEVSMPWGDDEACIKSCILPREMNPSYALYKFNRTMAIKV